MSTSGRPQTRARRSSSLQQAMNEISNVPTPGHPEQLPTRPAGDEADSESTPSRSAPKKRRASPSGRKRGVRPGEQEVVEEEPKRKGAFIRDLYTMQWMREPASSFKIIVIILACYFNWRFITPQLPNPFEHLIFISNPVGPRADDPAGTVRYAKSYWDLAFLVFYVVVFSFTRQFITEYILRPLAKTLGLRKEAKIQRFLEQSYTCLYFTCFGSLGIWVMSQQKTWWYKTEHFWLEYPHWDMKPVVKTYYLLQFSYWLQQLLVLALRLEKPRKDFKELVAHHIVTLWLIGWSYGINLTMIGNAIFVTMDVSDIFLAFAKCVNYVTSAEIFSTIVFGWFIIVWTYLRHWLNLKILWSVWYEFDLIPIENKRWWTPDGVWMVDWMKYQIFAPILLLQLLNLFWYFLIWRILIRAIRGNVLADERSEDEDEGEDAPAESVEAAKAE